MLHIVLVEPEIPANTGNISRTCVITNTALHLVRPLGFSTDDKHLKRAGLDYWPYLTLYYHDSIEEVMERYSDHRFFFCTTKCRNRHSDTKFRDEDFLVFGKETKGLPETLLHSHWDQCIRIPMQTTTRSLNLSNSVAIVLYEALRQIDYPGLV